MSVQKCLEEMKKIQETLLGFLEEEDDTEERFSNICNCLTALKIYDDRHKIKSILHLISMIASNFHRKNNFFTKIERIIQLFKDCISKFFTNSEIFNIFKRNKRIILFLCEEKIVKIDEYIFKMITQDIYFDSKYPQYFWPEIKTFISHNNNTNKNSNMIEKSENINSYDDFYEEFIDDSSYNNETEKEIDNDNWMKEMTNNFPENFEEKRRKGENEGQICEYIRKDQIKEFIVYVNKTNFPLTSSIKLSIFETNSFLLHHEPTLIEYATFYGSIQIFNYLIQNQVELTPTLWLYAIHGQNSEIIHVLEDKHIQPNENSYLECLKESIKCHHNDIVNYFKYNYLQNEEENSLIQSIKKYNFAFINSNLIDKNETSFFYLCKYDYYNIIELILKEKYIDINKFYRIGSIDETALFSAFEKKNIDICRLLLSYQNVNANIGWKCSSNIHNPENYWVNYIEEIIEEKSLLFEAVLCNNTDIIKLLLQCKNIDINIGYKKDLNRRYDKIKTILKEAKTPLFFAVEKRNKEMIKLLVSTQNIKNDFGYFVNLGDEEIIKKSSLYKSIENEDNDIALLLLSNETINVNQINKYMIHWSHPEILKEEKNEERDNGYGSYPYKWYDDCVIDTFESYLGNERVEITDLCSAIEKNENEIVEQLLNHITIDINIPYKLKRDWKFGYEGDTEPCKFKEIIKHSLYIAIENNNFEIVKLLTSHKSLDINFQNIIKNVKIKSDSYRGDQTSFKRYYELIETSFYLAVEKRNLKIIELLLTNKEINVNIPMTLTDYWNYRNLRNGGGLSFNEKKRKTQDKTGLYLAIEHNDIEIILLLLSCENLDVNNKNVFSNCWLKHPVYYNICGRYDEERQRKMDSFCIKENICLTALHFAIEIQNVEIVKLLLAFKNIDVNILSNNSKINKKSVIGHVILDNDEGDGLDIPYKDTDGCCKWTENIEKTSQKTPLYMAVETKNIEIFEALLAINDIDINLKSIFSTINKKNEGKKNGEEELNDNEIKQRTPLHLAIENQVFKMTILLLSDKRIDDYSKEVWKEIIEELNLKK